MIERLRLAYSDLGHGDERLAEPEQWDLSVESNHYHLKNNSLLNRVLRYVSEVVLTRVINKAIFTSERPLPSVRETSENGRFRDSPVNLLIE